MVSIFSEWDLEQKNIMKCPPTVLKTNFTPSGHGVELVLGKTAHELVALKLM